MNGTCRAKPRIKRGITVTADQKVGYQRFRIKTLVHITVADGACLTLRMGSSQKADWVEA